MWFLATPEAPAQNACAHLAAITGNHVRVTQPATILSRDSYLASVIFIV